MSEGNISYVRANLIRMALIFVVVGVIPACIYIYRHYQSGPFGRSQIVALDPQQESQLGAQTFQQVLAKSSVESSGPLADKIREIGDRLAKASNNPEFLQITKVKPQNFSWE